MGFAPEAAAAALAESGGQLQPAIDLLVASTSSVSSPSHAHAQEPLVDGTNEVAFGFPVREESRI